MYFTLNTYCYKVFYRVLLKKPIAKRLNNSHQNIDCYIITPRMLSKNEIIEIHGKIIIDLLVMIDKSKNLPSLLNIKTIIYNGIVMLNHIFVINIIHDIPRDILLHNCQTGCFYYLEYIEQAFDKNIVQKMDFSTIHAFIYKQTINFLNTSNPEKPPSVICNLLNILQKNTQVLILLNIELPLKTLIKIANCYLIKFAKLFSKSESKNIYYTFFTMVFEKMHMITELEPATYFILLDVMYLHIQKNKNTQDVDENVLYFLLNDYNMNDKNQLKKMVKDVFI